jgi:histidine triad (HIT) family protein
VFCNIVKHKAPAEIFFQNGLMAAFKDTNPQPTVHTLLIPNDHIVNLAAVNLQDEMLLGQMLVKIAELGAGQCPNGFRVITNTGRGAHQTVFHMHFHILDERDVGTFSTYGNAFENLETTEDMNIYECTASTYNPHFIITPTKAIPNLASVTEDNAPLFGRILLKISHYGHTYFSDNFRVIINSVQDAHQENLSNLYIHIIGTKGSTQIPTYAFSETH